MRPGPRRLQEIPRDIYGNFILDIASLYKHIHQLPVLEPQAVKTYSTSWILEALCLPKRAEKVALGLLCAFENGPRIGSDDIQI